MRMSWLVAVLLSLGAATTSGAAGVRSDFDGDGKADILWRNGTSGRNQVWLMNGTTVRAASKLGELTGYAWRVQAVVDFDGDGKADVLWRHADSGNNAIWTMNGGQRSRTLPITSMPDLDWQLAAACDLDGNGAADIVWRHAATGEVRVFLVSNASVRRQAALSTVTDPLWRIAGCGDVDGDGKADLLWRRTTGENSLWLMDGSTLRSQVVLPSLHPAWSVADLGDLDGDGRIDVVWRHTSGANSAWFMSGSATPAAASLPMLSDTAWQVALVSDFDGDHRADVLWRNATTGALSLWLMNGATLTTAATPGTMGDLGWSVGALPSGSAASTLFLATLLSESGVTTSGTGTSVMVLAADRRSARVSLSYSGLSSQELGAHVHGPADAGATAPAILGLPNDSFSDFLWVFGLGTEAGDLETGRLYVSVKSALYPNGELRGQYRIVPGSGTVTTPPPPPTPGVITASDAARFLEQATFGPTPALVAHVQQVGYDAFLDEQFAATPSTFSAFVAAASTTNDTNRIGALRSRFFINALRGDDQLRQRVAFALSQHWVVSAAAIPDGPALATYMDLMGQHAFGNFRQLMQDVTLNPLMGDYLDMVNNDRPDAATGRSANENYARELMQLFTIGLYELNSNGTLRTDERGQPIPTYDQTDIESFARVFTG